MPSRFALALATARAALVHFSAFSLFFVVLGTIAVGRGLASGWLEPFAIGNVVVPKLTGAMATNVTVAVFCAVAIVTIAVGFVVRYFQHRALLALLRARGVTDLDQDGRTDVFTDRFLDDF